MSAFDKIRYDNGRLYRDGKEAGWTEKHGYRYISISNRKYLTHRVVWFLHHGTWPAYVDHINQDSLDNRIENLRACSQSINVLNKDAPQPYNKTSGIRGVHRHRVNNKWIAQITVKGKCKYLGSFDCKYEARDAYLKAKQEVFDNA